MLSWFRSLPETFRGVGFTAAGELFSRATSLVVFVLLARALEPAVFGVVAYGIILVGLGQTLTELGFREALIRRTDIAADALDTAFSASLAVALVLAVLTVAGAGAVEAAFGIPAFGSLVPYLVVVYICNALSLVPSSLLQKWKRFDRLAFGEVLSVVAGGAAGVAWAYQGYGIAALGLQLSVGAAVRAGALWYMTAWSPQGLGKQSALREMWAFGGYLTGTRTLQFIAQNVDNVIVGALLGPTALGLYSRGYQLVTIPNQIVGRVVNRVMLVRLLELRDPEAVRERYLRLCRIVAATAGPPMILAAVLADWYVAPILSDQWAGLADILEPLAVFGLLTTLGVLRPVLFVVSGATDVQFRLKLVTRSLLIGTILASTPFGMTVLSWSILGVSLVNSMLAIYYSGREISVGIPEYVRNLAAIGLALSALAVLSRACIVAAMGWLPDLSAVVLAALIGVGAYAVVLLLIRATVIGDIKAILKRLIGGALHAP